MAVFFFLTWAEQWRMSRPHPAVLVFTPTVAPTCGTQQHCNCTRKIQNPVVRVTLQWACSIFTQDGFARAEAPNRICVVKQNWTRSTFWQHKTCWKISFLDLCVLRWDWMKSTTDRFLSQCACARIRALIHRDCSRPVQHELFSLAASHGVGAVSSRWASNTPHKNPDAHVQDVLRTFSARHFVTRRANVTTSPSTDNTSRFSSVRETLAQMANCHKSFENLTTQQCVVYMKGKNVFWQF